MDISWNKWKSSKCREKQPLDSFPSLWPMIMRKLYPTACTLTKKAQVNGKKAHQILTFTQKPPGAVLQILRKFTNLHFFSTVDCLVWNLPMYTQLVNGYSRERKGNSVESQWTRIQIQFHVTCSLVVAVWRNIAMLAKGEKKKTWILPGWKLNKS